MPIYDAVYHGGEILIKNFLTVRKYSFDKGLITLSYKFYLSTITKHKTICRVCLLYTSIRYIINVIMSLLSLFVKFRYA